MRYLRARGWKKYQHGNKPGLPWIKLYTDLLAPHKQPKYAGLPDATKLLLHHIWLMASVFNDHIPEDWVTKEKLNVQSRISLESLLESDYVFWEDDSSLLAGAQRASDLSSSELSSSELTPQQEEVAVILGALHEYVCDFDFPKKGGRFALWAKEYGSEWVASVIQDVGAGLDGKGASYLQAILQSRHAAGWVPRRLALVAQHESGPDLETRKANERCDENRELGNAIRLDLSRFDRTGEWSGAVYFSANGGLREVCMTPEEAKGYLDYLVEKAGHLHEALTFAEWHAGAVEAK